VKQNGELTYPDLRVYAEPVDFIDTWQSPGSICSDKFILMVMRGRGAEIPKEGKRQETYDKKKRDFFIENIDVQGLRSWTDDKNPSKCYASEPREKRPKTDSSVDDVQNWYGL
jgi:hypothetical protein